MFFFKQKTAYELRISDWSSDVCSSDLVNPVSNRAAVRIPAPGRMYDDGSVEERVRLVRPMGRETMSVRDFAASHWEPSLHNRFGTLWEREISEVPQFSVSEFHVITGLLLPIWDRLPGENMRVYRLQTDRACPRACQGQDPGGERGIGRPVTPAAPGRVYGAHGAHAANAPPAGEGSAG